MKDLSIGNMASTNNQQLSFTLHGCVWFDLSLGFNQIKKKESPDMLTMLNKPFVHKLLPQIDENLSPNRIFGRKLGEVAWVGKIV